MALSTDKLPKESFVDPFHILQLADDTAILADNLKSLKDKFTAIFNYSDTKYQVISIGKTVYYNFASNLTSEHIVINNSLIKSVSKTDGHKYLGMRFIPDNMNEIIIRNLNERLNNTCLSRG